MYFSVVSWRRLAIALTLLICHNLAAKAQSSQRAAELLQKLELLDATVVERVPQQAVPILQEIRRFVSQKEGIVEFRRLDSLEDIRKLVDISALLDRGLRIEASLILANVVDNTTVCAVLNKLRDVNLNDNTRFNLLQVVKVVAHYARLENREWIHAVLTELADELKAREDLQRTKILFGEIEQVLRDVRLMDNVTFEEKYPKEYEACRDLMEAVTAADEN